MRKLYLYGWVMLFSVSLSAQDEFFASFRTAGLTLNPAEAGRIATQARFTALGRTQWNTISGAPYRAVFAGLETQAFCLGENFFGGSLSAAMEQSGSSRFQRLRAQGGLSYHEKIGSRVYLSGGIELGILQHSLGNTDLRFDRQFDGTEYDPGSASGEAFLRFSNTRMDAAAGVLLYQQQGRWSIGVSVDHLFTPSMSFLEEDVYTLGRGLVVHGNAHLVSLGVPTRPDLVLGVQGMYRRYALFNARQWHSILGVYGVAALGKSAGSGPLQRFFRTDLSVRLAGAQTDPAFLVDAILVTATFAREGWQFGLTYDATVSQLGRATAGFGGIELFLSLPFAGERTCVLCPDF